MYLILVKPGATIYMRWGGGCNFLIWPLTTFSHFRGSDHTGACCFSCVDLEHIRFQLRFSGKLATLTYYCILAGRYDPLSLFGVTSLLMQAVHGKGFSDFQNVYWGKTLLNTMYSHSLVIGEKKRKDFLSARKFWFDNVNCLFLNALPH